MAGADRQLFIPCRWKTRRITITTTATEITNIPDVKDLSTVVIQSAASNPGARTIYFGEDNTITSAGLGNVGGDLKSSQSAQLPLCLKNDSRLWAVASTGTMILYVSYFDGGVFY